MLSTELSPELYTELILFFSPKIKRACKEKEMKYVPYTTFLFKLAYHSIGVGHTA